MVNTKFTIIKPITLINKRPIVVYPIYYIFNQFINKRPIVVYPIN